MRCCGLQIFVKKRKKRFLTGNFNGGGVSPAAIVAQRKHSIFLRRGSDRAFSDCIKFAVAIVCIKASNIRIAIDFFDLGKIKDMVCRLNTLG